MLKLICLVLNIYLVRMFDFGAFYNWIRGETSLKMLVFYNLLELSDKLLNQLGQDLQDSLFFAASRTIESVCICYYAYCRTI